MPVDKVKQITEELPDKIKELFESEKYAEYLKVMGKFSNYSFYNTLLIASQRPDATQVAGYKAWQNQFDRHVVAGAKGIQIIQPAPYKKNIEETIKDEHGNVVCGYDGKPLTHKEEVIVPAFKVGYVYALEDTEGAPLPDIVQILDKDVADYDQMISILKSISPVPVVFHVIPGGANGYYSHADGGIHVKEDLPELQKIKTTIHEMAHAILHNKMDGTDQETTRREKEVEAESVAYTVCSYLGLDTSDYSFGYIAGWSEGKELKELKDTMEKIRETSSTIIERFNEELLRRKVDQEHEICFKYPEGYLWIQESEEGYDYSLYERDFTRVDGGVVIVSIGQLSLYQLAKNIMDEKNIDIDRAQLCDIVYLVEKVQEKANKNVNEIKEKQTKSTKVKR